MSQHPPPPPNPEGFPEGELGRTRRSVLGTSSIWYGQFLLASLARKFERFGQPISDPLSRDGPLGSCRSADGWQAEDWFRRQILKASRTISKRPRGEFPARRMVRHSLDGDPYTLHRHPVFIVTLERCLVSLTCLWRRFALWYLGFICGFARNVLWALAGALSSAEREMLLALQSLDMGRVLCSPCLSFQAGPTKPFLTR